MLAMIISVLLALLVIALVAWPILKAWRQPPPADALSPDNRYQELLAQRDAIYRDIKELEFDHKAGKVSDEDHRSLDARLKAEAVAVLQELDRLVAANGMEQVPSLQHELEAEIAAFRSQQQDRVDTNEGLRSVVLLRSNSLENVEPDKIDQDRS